MKSPSEKILLIDHLIHGFHFYFKEVIPTRPVAVNLIKGRLFDVIVFPEGLTYSNLSTPGLKTTQREWEENLMCVKNRLNSPVKN